MPTHEPEDEQSTMGVDDILFILFKHKWKIAILSIAGVIAAAAFYFFKTPLYESQAKLLVRYVVDRSSVDSVDSKVNPSGSAGDSLIIAEQEILTSWDLAAEVAEALTVEKLSLEGAGKLGKTAAASAILSGLSVNSSRGSNVITVSYKNADPVLANRVLDELLNRYFEKHLQVHRSLGSFEFVTRQTDQVKATLSKTEDALRQLKAKTGITNFPQSVAALESRMVKAQQELDAAEAQRAEEQALINELERALTGSTAKQLESADAKADTAELQRYEALVGRLSQLRQTELDMLAKYTPDNRLVKLHQAQIDKLENQRREMEKKHPGLVAAVSATNSPLGAQGKLISERARLVALDARIEALRSLLLSIQKETERLSDAAPQITQLERKKELEEANYKYFDATLEKARIDEALDPSKMPNISIVQKPSPPQKAAGKTKKVLLGLACGGVGLGLGLAFLIELLLNRTVKRPLELESRLRIPLMLSIPAIARKVPARLKFGRRQSPSGTALQQATLQEVSPWDPAHFIRPFAEALRDRLVLYFQLNNLTHKPKLIGVTGCSEGAGASTIASGLASALSETGDGKVLLVDMNVGDAQAHPFFAGRPASSLTEALEPTSVIPEAADNLYLATAAPQNAGPVQLIPKKFYDLLPHLKACTFDYIIFDMPPVTGTSATLAMAGFMDKVLFVVGAERTNRDVVKRAYSELVAAKAKVSAVFNKTHSYTPKWLQG